MFKPCPNCGFLVALIAGREASQRCPRCGSAMLEDGELPPADEARATPAAIRSGGAHAGGPSSARPRASGLDPQDDAAAPAGRTGRASRDGSAATDAGGRHTSVPGSPDLPRAAGLRDSAAQGPAGGVASTTHAGGDGHAGHVAPSTAVAASTARTGEGAGVKPDPDTSKTGTDTGADTAAAPSFTTRGSRRPRARPGRRWPWLVALPVLALLLAVQLLLSQRAELAQDATWRPLVSATCSLLGCDVPPWREPSAFAMLARNVRPHAARAGVLHVTTSLRNDAPWPQPLPVVVLSLSDVDGRVLAARAVPPTDYGRAATTLVDPGDSIDIAFDVREPSPRVVSFDFQLR